VQNLAECAVEEPLYVWSLVRVGVIDWAYEIFCRSKDAANKMSPPSFIIFKENMQEIKNSAGPLLYLML
jgi:hypothetical protein